MLLSPLMFGCPGTKDVPQSQSGQAETVSPELVEGEPVEQALFPVQVDGKWGYIDRTGTIVIPPQFGFAGSFSEGLARVLVGNMETGKWGYIDHTGAYVWEPSS
jgi:hypothetical protein